MTTRLGRSTSNSRRRAGWASRWVSRPLRYRTRLLRSNSKTPKRTVRLLVVSLSKISPPWLSLWFKPGLSGVVPKNTSEHSGSQVADYATLAGSDLVNEKKFDRLRANPVCSWFRMQSGCGVAAGRWRRGDGQRSGTMIFRGEGV